MSAMVWAGGQLRCEMAKRQRDPEARGIAKFDAYYYSFEPTGVAAVDRILAAVALAGKRFHGTEDWDDEDPDVESCVECIQRIANESAAALLTS